MKFAVIRGVYFTVGAYAAEFGLYLLGFMMSDPKRLSENTISDEVAWTVFVLLLAFPILLGITVFMRTWVQDLEAERNRRELG